MFAHWIWCLPVFLIFAFLAIRQINWYSPDIDEYYSMYHTGYHYGEPLSSIDVIASLYTNSPDQMPAYYLLLGIWQDLTGHDLGVGRYLTVLCSMLFLAIVHRLSSDAVAPMAGLMAITIASSNAFFNFYVAQLRFYPLLLFAAGIVLWLYLRIMDERQSAGNRELVALGLGVFFALHVHASIAYFLAVLAAFHIFFAQRGQKWRPVIVAVAGAAIMSLPYYAVLATMGLDRTAIGWPSAKHGAWETIASWLTLSTNGQPLLAAIAVCGIVLAVSQRASQTTSLVLLTSIHIIVLGAFTELTGFVLIRRMRYHLPTWLIAVVVMAAGLYFLYRHRRWFGLLVLLWIVAGILFQIRNEWRPYMGPREDVVHFPPWQVLAPMAAESEPVPKMILYSVSRILLDRINYDGRTQEQHYFSSAGLEHRRVA